MAKKIIAFMNCESKLTHEVIEDAVNYEVSGGDAIFLFNYSNKSSEIDSFFKIAKEVIKAVEIPTFIGCHVKRFEDIKKALYTGASYVVIRNSDVNYDVILEGSKRFGKDKILIQIDELKDLTLDYGKQLYNAGVYGVFVDNIRKLYDMEIIKQFSLPVYLYGGSLQENHMAILMKEDNVMGLAVDDFKGKNLYHVKVSLKAAGIDVNMFDSSLSFADFKLNSDGLLPVVVQDYKTREVLMVAYMNEEAFLKTIETGKMTYFSRSRNELWIKGETSGHYQYVKELLMDCDKDTLLAKVKQVGGACHTGNKTCFYTSLLKKEYDGANPLTVFQDVYDLIVDRKENPKEGSYTNYLFEKGIDKILKKCGEEATEIVIAAKNPDAEELKYEISDFLYHMMVLMVECNVSWDDILKELVNRR